MQVLQIITRSEWGGAARVVKSLATGIPAKTTVACGPGGKLIDELEPTDVQVAVQPHLRSPPHPADFLAYRDLSRLISTGEFDIVHCHSTKAGALGRIAAYREGVPSVFTVHGWGFYNTEHQLMQPLLVHGERYLADETDKIVCVSENDRQVGQHTGILSQSEGTVIRNGIEPPKFPVEGGLLHSECNINEGTPIIGAITRLAPQKDPLKILEVTRRLRARGHEFAVVLIGTGPLASECRSFIKRHDLTNFHLLGFQEEALQMLPEMDIFLLPSRFEGFPIALLECLHAGVPVVAHDVGGVAEAIDDGVTGYIVPPDSTERFVDRVETLLELPNRGREFGYRATQIANSLYTEDRMVKSYNDLYKKILEE